MRRLEEAAVVLVVAPVRLGAELLVQLLEQRPLLVVEPARDVDAGMDVEVAAPPAFERRHPLTPQHLHVAWLDTRRDLDLDLTRRARRR